MHPSQRRIGVLVIALSCLLASPAWSNQGSSTFTEAENLLQRAFGAYCDTLKPTPPGLCKSGASIARKYMALEVLCSLGSSDPFCTTFGKAKSPETKGSDTLAPLVLDLDHKTGRWTARNRLLGAGKGRLKMDVAGEPTVSLAKRERITVVVSNTNPLLYGLVAGKPTEVDVPELATIQKLLSAAGGSVAAFVQTLGAREKAKAAGDDPFGEYSRAILKSLKSLEAALLEVECRTGQAAAQTSRAVTFLQDIELGVAGRYSLVPPAPGRCAAVSRLVAADVEIAFEKLGIELFSPQDSPEDCAPLLDAARKVVTSDPANPTKVSEALSELDQVSGGSCDEFQGLSDAVDLSLKGVKEALQYAEDAGVEMRANAAELKQLEGLKAPTTGQKSRLKKLRDEKELAEEAVRGHLVAMRQALQDEKGVETLLLDASNDGKALAAIRKSAEEILGKRDAMQKSAAQVQLFERRLEMHRIRPYDDCSSGPCVESTSLDLRLFHEPQLKEVRQTKIQKYTFTVKPDSPYASKVAAARPAEVKAGYSLDSVLRGLWGISASLIYTGVSSPTFGAVTSEEDSEKKVLAVIDETTRAGDIALLADFRLGRWLKCRKAYSKCKTGADWFGVEFGAGVSGEPAFFGGLSFRPSRSWRLGVGYTYQQVKELQSGMKLGQEIAGTDDIRTRDDFRGDWYVSLSFALESLKLFSSGE